VNQVMHMRTFKWSIFLPTVNVVLALGLCALGLREYESDHRLHPEYFYHGNLYYLPPAQIADYCLNMPAYAASSAFAELGVRVFRSDSPLFTKYFFFYAYWGFFVAVGCLWWWLGYQLESHPSQTTLKEATIGRYAKILIYVIIALLSLVMAYDGFMMRSGELVARAIPFAKLAWGIGLAAYLLILIYRDLRTARRVIP
jgi:hypothetical protein